MQAAAWDARSRSRWRRTGAAVLVNDVGAGVDGRGTDASPATAVAREIVDSGGRAVADVTDVASIAGGSAVVTATLAAFGRVDVVVNNAGFASGGGDVEHPVDDELDALLAVHFKAALGTMSAAFPEIRAQGYGRIVNIVSEVALDARFAGGIGYGAAKAALWSATLAAAHACEGTGITVNAVSPGARTRMSADALDAGLPTTARRMHSISIPPTSHGWWPTSRRRRRPTSTGG